MESKKSSIKKEQHLEPKEGKETMHSVLLEQECNVLEKLHMIKKIKLLKYHFKAKRSSGG